MRGDLLSPPLTQPARRAPAARARARPPRVPNRTPNVHGPRFQVAGPVSGLSQVALTLGAFLAASGGGGGDVGAGAGARDNATSDKDDGGSVATCGSSSGGGGGDGAAAPEPAPRAGGGRAAASAGLVSAVHAHTAWEGPAARRGATLGAAARGAAAAAPA